MSKPRRYPIIFKNGVVEQVNVKEPGAYELSDAEKLVSKLQGQVDDNEFKTSRADSFQTSDQAAQLAAWRRSQNSEFRAPAKPRSCGAFRTFGVISPQENSLLFPENREFIVNGFETWNVLGSII